MCITYTETDVQCPICTFEFNVGEKMSKAKYPLFKMKCPACKSWIGISIPILGGNTECFEWNPPKTKRDNRLKCVTPNKVNGEVVVERKEEDESTDGKEDILV